MICPNCNQLRDDKSTGACPYCGQLSQPTEPTGGEQFQAQVHATMAEIVKRGGIKQPTDILDYCCQECGKKTGPHLPTCSKSGSPQPSQVASKGNLCAKCFTENPASEEICSKCGYYLPDCPMLQPSQVAGEGNLQEATTKLLSDLFTEGFIGIHDPARDFQCKMLLSGALQEYASHATREKDADFEKVQRSYFDVMQVRDDLAQRIKTLEEALKLGLELLLDVRHEEDADPESIVAWDCDLAKIDAALKGDK